MNLKLILLVFSILIIAGCNQKVNNQSQTTESFMKVNFKTSDNVNIVGNFYDVKSDKNVILLHMFSKTKESWGNFPNELKKNGFNVLAIDLRGHGESDLDYNRFTDKNFNSMVKDVEAVISYMKNKNDGKIYLIGASIGANTVLNYATQNKVEKIVLLSPGLNFKGINTDASNLKTDVLFVASKDDSYSFESVNKLYEQAKGKKELKVYEKAGHGTNMFSQKDLSSYIINWLKAYL